MCVWRKGRYFGRSDKMMKNKWKSGYTKTYNGLIIFRAFSFDRNFSSEKEGFFKSLANEEIDKIL